ncbi:SAUR-like auxin-responsive protein family [Perilla frutescens var. hirtella]|nr:SAUR-like auxin-responsive protein family [Perilla frutescens var. frutescens]KAH6788030.1 SAUR-like auxin-responsive protein family [Perilla frutescens var. hirtella]
MAKCNKIQHIVRIRQMLRSWRKKATSPAACHRLPSDVPAGHVAICVGASCRRFVVRATHLNHPIFRRLLSQAGEEFGFANYSGPLAIPCDESLFEEILGFVSRGDSDFQRCCHVGVRNESSDFLAGESRPLLYGFSA